MEWLRPLSYALADHFNESSSIKPKAVFRFMDHAAIG